jgi:hypothetical protein
LEKVLPLIHCFAKQKDHKGPFEDGEKNLITEKEDYAEGHSGVDEIPSSDNA